MKFLKFQILILITLLSSPFIAYFAYQKYEDHQIEQAFQKRMQEADKLQKIQEEYLKEQERELRKLTKLYKSDHYGGKTPEETLRLFVEALKKKDYKLAAKYYVPEKWEWAEEEMKKWLSNEKAVSKFLEAYDNNNMQINENTVGTAIILIYFDEQSPPYGIKMIKNEINNIWKISDF